ncbi:alpha/beta fold hydrolase [Siculibacillus lacustris]|nr:alpha/beta hydrolase [Siculibacillus lacustris]
MQSTEPSAPAGVAFGPVRGDALGTTHRPFRYFSRDGLALAGRDYPPARPTDRPPVVCLPGLTRNGADFEPAARRLTAGAEGSPARQVVTVDFRGRGASQWDADPARYTILQELDDTLLGLDLLGIDRFTAFGTSRGGLVTMIAGLVAPGRVTTAVLNDIGPVIELDGLLLIKQYLGRPLPEHIGWSDLVDARVHVNRPDYPNLDRAGFERLAHRLCRDVDGRPVLDYDPRLADGFAAITAENPPADLWEPFASLAGIPTLVVRGTLSRLLSAETVAAMAARHPRLEVLEVPDEGHPPLFDDDVPGDRSVAALVAFLDRVGA